MTTLEVRLGPVKQLPVHTIHGKAVERDDAVRGVVDGELLHPQPAPDVRLGGTGTVVVKMLQHMGIP